MFLNFLIKKKEKKDARDINTRRMLNEIEIDYYTSLHSISFHHHLDIYPYV